MIRVLNHGAKLVNMCRRVSTTNTRLYFAYGMYAVPLVGRNCPTGSDAYHCSQDLLVMADGLSFWDRCKYAGGKYASQLCKNIGEIYKNQQQALKANPKKLLSLAVEKMSDALGGSTCCILTLDNDKKAIHGCNIGDSGFIILRKDGDGLRSIAKSAAQWHNFDVPFNIGAEADTAENADDYREMQIMKGDIIVLGTDGLWGLLDDTEVINSVHPFVKHYNEILDLETIAEFLASYANKKAESPLLQTPFKRKAYEYNFKYATPKPNDITVVVAQIQEGE